MPFSFLPLPSVNVMISSLIITIHTVCSSPSHDVWFSFFPKQHRACLSLQKRGEGERKNLLTDRRTSLDWNSHLRIEIFLFLKKEQKCLFLSEQLLVCLLSFSKKKGNENFSYSFVCICLLHTRSSLFLFSTNLGSDRSCQQQQQHYTADKKTTAWRRYCYHRCLPAAGIAHMLSLSFVC